MNGSGKQILLKILTQLSTQLTAESELENATSKMRAGLLLHGSTSDENYRCVNNLQWSSSYDEDQAVWRQGIATVDGQIFIADLVESLMDLPNMHASLLAEYPGLTAKGLDASLQAIWLIISAVQMYSQLREVEVDEAQVDVEKRVAAMTKHFNHHFNSEN
ncbi:MAG: hypothetical protein EOO68_11230 [Moraxellaceae bacterium]|jgi:hypothetical protein|nr:MAG: hypothetical protein EOO68_11230 [Moraxellaceae bacterium]